MAKEKGLNERVDDALIAVSDAREAMDGAHSQGEDLGASVKKLSREAGRLRKLLEGVGEIFDDIDSALSTIESELESLQELKLEAHVDALEEVAATLEDVSGIELESE